MQLQNETITKVHNNTTYKNCTFDIDYEMEILHNIHFDNCRFTNNTFIAEEVSSCVFTNCRFEKFHIKRITSTKFENTKIDTLVIYMMHSEEFVKVHFNRNDNSVLLKIRGCYESEHNRQNLSKALGFIQKQKSILCDMQFLKRISVSCFWDLQQFITNRQNCDIRFYNVPPFAENLFTACRLSHKIDHALNNASKKSHRKSTPTELNSKTKNAAQFTYAHRNYCVRATMSPLQKKLS
ncbi:hypothetical protein [Candidatus Uabimicrobium amorphum]|uniref:Uncharacterized protein n=1 Tax=Uabimicrobium amorphum TaxID=2596890 RepID=A0A5S9IQ40_UABAM|nr:hypothetical protein [Candidatus Uabimicrobium amorphum]BBM85999.1 hypothetical protein UABAM_04385 [Candidatus Uabimicrobium amorphum]